MELSERFIQTLEQEGYETVYEWQDKPGTVHTEHSHLDKTTIYLTDGSMTIEMSDQKKTLSPGQRFDIPAGAKHSAIVGEAGAIYIVGEMSD